MNNMKSY